MLNPFFQPRYSTVLNEKSNNLLPTFSRCAAINYYTFYSALEMGIYYCVTVPINYYCFSDVQQSIVNLLLCHSTTNIRNRCSQLHCIEFNVTSTNFSINSYEEKVTSAISGDQSNYPIFKACGASNRIKQ